MPSRRPKGRPAKTPRHNRPNKPTSRPERRGPSTDARTIGHDAAVPKTAKGKSRQADRTPARLNDGLSYHPACLAFPMMGETELRELAEDIKENGQDQPVVLHGKVVLDGKNILAACKLAGVQPRFAQWEGTGSPTVWIVSQNLVRRHLTSSQRAVIALDLMPIFKREARDRQHHSANDFAEPTAKGKASEVAARLVKSNSRYVEAAKAIMRDAPELIEPLRNGTLNIPEATTVAELPKAERKLTVRRVENGENLRDILCPDGEENSVGAVKAGVNKEIDEEAQYFKFQTPEELCKRIIKAVPWTKGEFVLEPGRGEGNFYRNLPVRVRKDWCEIREGRDFSKYDGPNPDTIITNPPLRDKSGGKNLVVDWLERCLKITRDRVMALLSNDMLNTLTVKRLREYEQWGWGVSRLFVCETEKWANRYYFIVWEKGKPSILEQV